MSMKCMYLLTPLNPHFYIEKLGFVGIYLFFLFLLKTQIVQGFFFAILGRGSRAFAIGKISDVNPEFGKFSEYSKLIILPS